MRILLSVMLCFALALSGCSWMKAAKKPDKAQPRAGAPATTTEAPGNVLVGKVALVNGTARFVVLNFPLGKMAAAEQRLNLYRHGSKVGEVKVTGPQRADNIVADLVAGEAEIGDEARNQ
jgi:hypothetical protein